jgi:hypothetical protein
MLGTPDPDDRIFFSFSGDSAYCDAINDLSSVDAGMNYRRQQFSVQIGGSGSDITTGDGKNYLAIPQSLNGWRLEKVEGSLDVASSSGLPTFQLRRVRAGSPADMLTTKLTIDANETTSATAAAAMVPDTSNDDVLVGDRIYVDVDVAGTGAQWAILTLTFRRY